MSDGTENNAEHYQDLPERIERWYPFQKRELAVQRVFLSFLLLLIGAGLLGLFGEGMLSLQKVSSNKAEISYHRYVRSEARTDIHVVLNNVKATTVAVSFNSEYIQRVRMERITPEPISAKSKDGRVTYLFDAGDAGVIIFHLFPLDVGLRNLELSIQQETHHLTQFVYI